MAFVLLDSTVLIDYLRDRPAACGRLDTMLQVGDTPLTSAINVEELFRGLRTSERTSVITLFDSLQILPVGRAEAEIAGDWGRSFAGRGVTLSSNDCLIAAAAYMVGAKIATGNPKDFPMDEIEVQHWPVGE